MLVTVALAGSLLGATATAILNEAKATEVRTRTAADRVVTAGSSASAVYVLEDGTALIRSEARAADPRLLADTTELPLVAGKMSDLDDDSIIVNEEWKQHTVGERVDVWLGDGRKKSLRIAAVMPIGTGDNGVYVTPRNAPDAPVDRADVRLADGADATAVAAELRDAVRASGATVLTPGSGCGRRTPRPTGRPGRASCWSWALPCCTPASRWPPPW